MIQLTPDLIAVEVPKGSRAHLIEKSGFLGLASFLTYLPKDKVVRKAVSLGIGDYERICLASELDNHIEKFEPMEYISIHAIGAHCANLDLVNKEYDLVRIVK